MNERGSAMVTSLFFLTGLTVAAIVIAMVATSDKRVAQNDYTHTRSFYSSDAGSESAINWLRRRPTWPTPGANNMVVDQNNYTDLVVAGHNQSNKYRYDMNFVRVRPRPGYSKEYYDFDYTIVSEGASAKESSAMVEVQASRLFKVVY